MEEKQKGQGQTAFEAVCVATYAEDYLDFAENFTNVIQPGISSIRRLDAKYFGILKRLKSTQELLRKETDVFNRKKLCQDIKILLAQGQWNGDEKLQELSKISDLVDAKIQHLENDVKNFEPQKPVPETSSKRNVVSISGVSSSSLSRTPDSRLTAGSDSPTVNNQSRFSRSCEESLSYRSESARMKRSRRKKEFPDYVHEAEAGPVIKKERSVSSVVSNGGGESGNNGAGSNNSVNGPKKKRRKKNSDKGNKLPYNSQDVDPDEPTYCLCEQVSYGEMIGCDYNGCVIEWFHFNCVGLASKPKGKWYCPQCRGDKPNTVKPSLGK